MLEVSDSTGVEISVTGMEISVTGTGISVTGIEICVTGMGTRVIRMEISGNPSSETAINCFNLATKRRCVAELVVKRSTLCPGCDSK
jgi:succinyl-CoA synthetase beta subunit